MQFEVTKEQVPLNRMDGFEIRPGIFLIGEPVPIPDTNKLRCLANVGGMLASVELVLTFGRAE